MIELIQFPWSPFCMVTRRILEYGQIPFKITNIPNGERSLVWRVTKERYYQVPVIRDGRNVIFETDENSQVIAKYLNEKFQLGIFPQEWRGLQAILWQYIENEIEGPCFKLDDIYWEEIVPKSDQLRFLRHKERKFGRGCLDQWRDQQKDLLKQLSEKLIPFEQMLLRRPFLLDAQPRFVDFDLFGMLSNFLYSGHYKLPAAHTNLKNWFERISKIKLQTAKLTREKLRT
ncbi:MAG: glutathione S-transferase family protein [Verrucomicrobiota bacterium]